MRLLTGASAPDRLQALLQGGLLAVIRQLQEALALRLRGHQLLRRDSLATVVWVVVAAPAAELARGRIRGILEARRRQHGAVLAHPLLRAAERLVGGVRLWRQGQVDGRLR